MGLCVTMSRSNTGTVVVTDPTPAQIASAASLHAFAYTLPLQGHALEKGEEENGENLLLSESSGEFTIEDYAACADVARSRCGELVSWLRGVVLEHTQAKEGWRGGV